MLEEIELTLLNELFGTYDIFDGAYSLRVNGKGLKVASTEEVKISPKKGSSGINVEVKAGTKRGLAHIPVILSKSGLKDKVYNDFRIGANAEVLILAGCGVHNDATHLTQHDGIHEFFVDEGARVKYIETHFGTGKGKGKKALNPVTKIHLAAGAIMEIETTQIEGVDDAKRLTIADIGEGAKLTIKEVIETRGTQNATTGFDVRLDGNDAKISVGSRSVAKDQSRQEFYSEITGNAACMGHSECDAIIMDNGYVKATPCLTANHPEAQLIHEAAIGKIADEQIMKLQTLGLSRELAEQKIIDGFLR
ncbi:MAG: SufB/SufD family protein [Candidatus Saccharimonadales bacterium]